MPEHAGKLRDTGEFAGPFRVSAVSAEPAGVPRPADPADAGDRVGAAQPILRRSFAVRSLPAPRFQVTARGAMAAMFALFLVSGLIADWLGLGILTGLGYVAGCVLAPYFASRRALLQVVAGAPAVFLLAVIATQVLTAQGSSRHGRALSVLEGTLLSLAAAAAWLLIGTALCVVVAIRMGLIQRVRQLQAELRGDQAEEPNGPG